MKKFRVVYLGFNDEMATEDVEASFFHIQDNGTTIIFNEEDSSYGFITVRPKSAFRDWVTVQEIKE